MIKCIYTKDNGVKKITLLKKAIEKAHSMMKRGNLCLHKEQCGQVPLFLGHN